LLLFVNFSIKIEVNYQLKRIFAIEMFYIKVNCINGSTIHFKLFIF